MLISRHIRNIHNRAPVNVFVGDCREGFTYMYSEGAMAWPDPLDRPARTILTGEGGRGASRMKHAVEGDSGRIRRLVPDELDQIQMFPKGWTDAGMTDGQRAFCMGNALDGQRTFCMGSALVVGIPHAIGRVLASDMDWRESRRVKRSASCGALSAFAFIESGSDTEFYPQI